MNGYSAIGIESNVLWQQVGNIHTALLNDGVSISLPVYLKHLADAIGVGSLEVCQRPKTATVRANNDVIVGELWLSGDLDAFGAAVKACVIDGGSVIHKSPC